MTTRVPLSISVRLDAETEETLRRLAHERGDTVSSIVREAVAEFGTAHARQVSVGTRPYDRLSHLLGTIRRHGNRSERTGQKVRSILKAKTRARRPR
jgi:Ribbon-helix-helix protein, copG family